MRLTKIDQLILLCFFSISCISFWCGLQFGAAQNTILLRSACDVEPAQRIKLKDGFYAELSK